MIKTLVKHEGGIEVLFTVGNYLVSSCSCNNLCFWNLDSLELEKCLDAGFKSPTAYIIIDEETMITGGDTGGSQIDLDLLKVVGDYSGDFMIIEGLVQLNDEEVIIATQDYSTSTNNFYLLNIYSMDISLHMKNVHNDICEACIKMMITVLFHSVEIALLKFGILKKRKIKLIKMMMNKYARKTQKF